MPPGWWPAALAAVALPVLIAYSVLPTSTFANQAAALIGWGVLLLVMTRGLVLPRGPREAGAAWAVVAALLLLALSAVVAVRSTALPMPLAASALGMIAAAALAAGTGAALRRAGRARPAFEVVAAALCVGGALSAFVAMVQVFWPEASGNALVAFASAGERAVGNVRQPNHLSTYLLWAMAATVWLGEAGRLPRRLAGVLLVAMLFGVVLSASRTGMLGVLMLSAWGLVDRRLSSGTRRLLWALPLLYVVGWAGVSHWVALQGDTFVGEAQLHKADISSSRFAIWRNTLVLIAQHPWTGVGFGGFNFAWSLTPFPDRPVAFFDHTHNLALQFAVELGLPLALLVLALLAFALWRMAALARDAEGDEALLRRAALMIVLIAAVHSQLEYPLWYAYFLLPCAFVFGLGTERDAPPRTAPVGGPCLGPRLLAVAPALLLAGALLAIPDYRRVAIIFAPPDPPTPLVQRVLDGQHSWFFAHHADYAAATISRDPEIVLDAVSRASHFLLDTRLMVAWAQALAEVGEVDKARHLAQRLREFRNPASDEFFAACDAPAAASSPKPFQCSPPTRRFDARDFR